MQENLNLEEFNIIFNKIGWNEIKNCPGRFLIDKKYQKEFHQKEPLLLLSHLLEDQNLFNRKQHILKSPHCKDEFIFICKNK
jgi:hypothetical protein